MTAGKRAMHIVSTPSCLNGLFFLHMALMSMGLMATISAHAGSPANESPTDRILNHIKETYDFETWAGTVKMNLSISSLANFDRKLQDLLKTPVASHGTNAIDELHMQVVESKTRSGCRIYMSLYPTAREAQEAPFKEFVTHARVPDYALALKGSDYDIGDMCLYNLAAKAPNGIVQVVARPFLGRLYFSRGNVAVKIINNAKQGKAYVDVLSVAKEIDALLCRESR